ncbi:allantoinase AllB [Glycomyces buryatensis]|uniref:allantoinase n=1 Tax=Glycomyces buryatensis TaxID=2570927 RepID=A0A4S8PVM3_9ACTN|nr:allantoinase AllB [Glycomyces buryatensis]THV35610.1 allantoinase AllB [Glycomyces buryatensis]
MSVDSDISAPVVYDLVIRSRRTVLPDGERPAAVAIAGERIAVIGDYDDAIPARHTEDLGDTALLPGLVDTHVHVNEPGRTEWEGFATATRAAAAGGVTTLIDMPLNSLPPTVDAAALDVKRAAAKGKTYVDVGFWGGAIPGNTDELKGLHEAGVFGFKCFTAPSGVDEFPPLDAAQIRQVCQVVAELGTVLLVHAENPDHLHETEAAPDFDTFLGTRPPEAETSAIRTVIDIARETGARVHILHLSAAEAAGAIYEAWLEGVRISAETCPHYLTIAAETVPDGATEYKCCPPVRGEANREALWQRLIGGDIDFIVSDHSPSPPSMKSGDFATAWGGISSIQLGLSLVWSEARLRGLTLWDVVRWMAKETADFAGLEHKGRIAAGADADLVAFDADREWQVRAEDLHHRHPITPYAGRTLHGQVSATWLRGKKIDTESAPRGRQLRRPRQQRSRT